MSTKMQQSNGRVRLQKFLNSFVLIKRKKIVLVRQVHTKRINSHKLTFVSNKSQSEYEENIFRSIS